MERIKLIVTSVSLVALGMGLGMLIKSGPSSKAVESTKWTPAVYQEPIMPRYGTTTLLGRQCIQIYMPPDAIEDKNQPISL